MKLSKYCSSIFISYYFTAATTNRRILQVSAFSNSRTGNKPFALHTQQQYQYRLFSAPVAPASSSDSSSTNRDTRDNAFLSSDDNALNTSSVIVDEKSSTASVPVLDASEIVARGVIVAREGSFMAIHVQDEDQNDPSGSTMSAVSEYTGHAVRLQVSPNKQQTGIVVAHRPPLAFLYSKEEWEVPADQIVKLDTIVEPPQKFLVQILSQMAKVHFSSKDVQVDPFSGDTSSDANDCFSREIFFPIPQVKDIALINHPSLTGISMVDALTPIGRGQNMLLVGSDIEAMRGYALDYILQQLEQNDRAKCVYAAIQNPEHVQKQIEELLSKNQKTIRNDFHYVVASTEFGHKKTNRAAEAVALAGSACAIAEAYAKKGEHTVVVIDTIDLHKELWDATTRTLVDVFGVDSVVQSDRSGGASSEMRAFYSSLIQRAAQFKESRGGGSVTLLMLTTIPQAETTDDTVFKEAEFDDSPQKIKDRIQLLINRGVPLTAQNLRKIDIPVPSDGEGRRRMVLQHVDDLISMSDGQIWFDEDLARAGQMPPIDPQRSITRVGIGADTKSRADAPAFRRIVERLRLDLSQASNMAGAEQTKASEKQVRRHKALLLAMHQEPGQGGRSLSNSCVALLAAIEGKLDRFIDCGVVAGSAQGRSLIQDLLDHVQAAAPETVAEIDSSLDISTENKTILIESISEFVERINVEEIMVR